MTGFQFKHASTQWVLGIIVEDDILGDFVQVATLEQFIHERQVRCAINTHGNLILRVFHGCIVNLSGKFRQEVFLVFKVECQFIYPCPDFPWHINWISGSVQAGRNALWRCVWASGKHLPIFLEFTIFSRSKVHNVRNTNTFLQLWISLLITQQRAFIVVKPCDISALHDYGRFAWWIHREQRKRFLSFCHIHKIKAKPKHIQQFCNVDNLRIQHINHLHISLLPYGRRL